MPAFSTDVQEHPDLTNQVMLGALQGMPNTMQDPATSRRMMNDFPLNAHDPAMDQLSVQVAGQAAVRSNIPKLIQQIVGEVAQTLIDELKKELDQDIDNADLGEIANLANITTALAHQQAAFDEAAQRRAQRMMGGLAEGVGEEIPAPPPAPPAAEEEAEPVLPEEELPAPQEGGKGGPAPGLPDQRKQKPYSPAEMAPTPEEGLGEQLGEGEGAEEAAAGAVAGAGKGAGGPAQQAEQAGQLQQDQQGARNQQREQRGAAQATDMLEESGDAQDPEIQEEVAKLSGSGKLAGKAEKGVHEKASAKEASKSLSEKLAASIPSSMLRNPEVVAMLAVTKDLTDFFGADDTTFKAINVVVSGLMAMNYLNQGSYFQRLFFKRFAYRFLLAIGAEFIPGVDMIPSHTALALYIWYSSEKEGKRRAELLENIRGILGKAKLT